MGEVRLLDCGKCSNWKCEELTLEEFKNLWFESIGGEVTPGISKRYEKEATRQGQDVSEVRIGFKYCSAGILTRFYIRRGPEDRKPMKKGIECPKFKEREYSEPTSRMWALCATESHGLSAVNGILFTPGLYENNTYMRIPFYDAVRPIVERREAVCSTCGQEVKKAITIRIEKSFCCNRHYLEWWAKRYLEECQKL